MELSEVKVRNDESSTDGENNNKPKEYEKEYDNDVTNVVANSGKSKQIM